MLEFGGGPVIAGLTQYSTCSYTYDVTCNARSHYRAYAYAMWKVYIVLQVSKKACSIMELATYIDKMAF